jgi:two-component system invasion response regulator UvrY
MRRILLNHSEAKILVLSMHTGMVAERAMQMGARGFVCKGSGAGALLTAINRIMQGGRYLDDAAGADMPKQLADTGASKALTKRELEVCILLSEGRSVGDIAGIMHLSEKTVYTHRQHIMDKLGVSTSVDLAQVAARMGILSGG